MPKPATSTTSVYTPPAARPKPAVTINGHAWVPAHDYPGMDADAGRLAAMVKLAEIAESFVRGVVKDGK